jgi:hypothetical protein
MKTFVLVALLILAHATEIELEEILVTWRPREPAAFQAVAPLSAKAQQSSIINPARYLSNSFSMLTN